MSTFLQPVVTSLLADHRLPLDDHVTAIWKAFPQDPQLATVITTYLIDLVSDFSQHNLFEENGTADSRFQKAKTGKGKNHYLWIITLYYSVGASYGNI